VPLRHDDTGRAVTSNHQTGRSDGSDRSPIPSEEFEALRPLLFAIAYRMLASASEAEDVVQEAFLRYQGALVDDVEIQSTKAYLSAVVTRLAIDELKSARKRRESYVGEWLPEPVVTDELDPAARVEEAESLSMAFLLLLHRLTPVERAVFLLHDVFAYRFAEIATIVGRSQASCRQIAVRARRRIRADRPRYERQGKLHGDTAARFFAALRAGDLDALLQLLAPGVVVYGDGGGKAPQWMVPISGVDRVGRLLVGLGGQIEQFAVTVEPHEINGQPGAIMRDRDGLIAFVVALEIEDGRVRALRSIINPDKLRHLGAVADVREALRGANR
jgi:RNA polymerase sigma-70 factor (ECF subfamily)